MTDANRPTIHDHRDYLLRAHQMDLGVLGRERLEELCHSLIDGQLVICEALTAETHQTAVIASQQQVITSLNEALGAANMALGADEPTNLAQELLSSMAAHVKDWWDEEREAAIDGMLTGIYRWLQSQNGTIDPELGRWWTDLLAKTVFSQEAEEHEHGIPEEAAR